jgi:uncharacterized protein (TIGR02145 family)
MNTTHGLKTFLTLLTGIIFITAFTMCSKSSDDNSTPTQITVTDIDGNVYHGVTIGTQVWMVENLKVTKYRNSDLIANVTDTSWKSLTTGAYCWYLNDVTNKGTYGALYNWFAVTDSRNIAPTGWHVPTDAEWETLITYLGGSNAAGGSIKEAGTSHWNSPNTGATNTSGFTALPGGRRISDAAFEGLHNYADLWSVTEQAATFSWSCELNTSEADAYRYIARKVNGLSVRCIKD